jgi:integrase
MGWETMANATVKKPKPIKGVYEMPAESGIWWINYYIEGRRFREKVGRRSDAVTLYQRRKTDARMGVKMPEVRARRAVLFEEIAADALVYSKEHKASYPGDRSTVGKLLPVFGKLPLYEITPQTIKAYLDTRVDLTKTTINRYRGTISMIFQEAIRNGKAKANPARLVRLHREDNSRVRFITYPEEAVIRAIIRERCPIHEPELTLALETGMRRGELYSLDWDRVDLDRRQLLLLKTKNGTARVVILTAAAASALEELGKRRSKDSPKVCLTRYGDPLCRLRLRRLEKDFGCRLRQHDLGKMAVDHLKLCLSLEAKYKRIPAFPVLSNRGVQLGKTLQAGQFVEHKPDGCLVFLRRSQETHHQKIDPKAVQRAQRFAFGRA